MGFEEGLALGAGGLIGLALLITGIRAFWRANVSDPLRKQHDSIWEHWRKGIDERNGFADTMWEHRQRIDALEKALNSPRPVKK
jgi:hypothetical protein